MRTAIPAIIGAAAALAIAFVWILRPADDEAAPAAPVARVPSAAVADPPPRAPAAVPVEPPAAAPAPGVARSPLPGEVPSTPMADLMAARNADTPAELAENEKEFFAEPIDTTWASGAEAALLARIAETPGLQLTELQVQCRSTMCRLQLTRPSGARGVQGGGPTLSISADSVGLEPRWLMAVRDATGSVRSIAYLWRDGFAPKQEPGQPHVAQ